MNTPSGPGGTPTGRHVIDGGPGLMGSSSVGLGDVRLEDGDLVTGSADVVLHEEQLRVLTERVGIERVRISKRIVTTTRTINVPVRIEQLVIAHEPLQEPLTQQNLITLAQEDLSGTVGTVGTAGTDLVITLHEEVPEVTLRVVAVERVVVGKRSVVGEQTLTVELAAETAEITTPDDVL